MCLLLHCLMHSQEAMCTRLAGHSKIMKTSAFRILHILKEPFASPTVNIEKS